MAEYRNPALDAAREEYPYLFNEKLRRELRAQYPDSVRQIWVCDGPEWAPEPDQEALAHDAVTALLIAGYENFQGHPILPSSVLLQAAGDIRIYGTGRYIKDPEDAADYLLTRDRRPYVNEFRRQVFGLVEDLHSRGLHMNTLLYMIEEETPEMMQAAIRIGNSIDGHVFTSEAHTAVWQELLIQRMPPDPSQVPA